MNDLDERVREAIRHFWQTRTRQAENQGTTTGVQDHGARRAVTGGRHLDGFINLVRELLVEVGLPEASIYCRRRVELPGYYRPQKQWDLLVILDSMLLATIEFKAQVGPSFGNNYNNRTEEALGNATDYWTAYREGAFRDSPRPWLGYLMLLEEVEGSTRSVNVLEPHFPVFEEFRNASYAGRYEVLLTKLIRERLYDGACFLMSRRSAIDSGNYKEPSRELSFQYFAASLIARARAYIETRGSR